MISLQNVRNAIDTATAHLKHAPKANKEFFTEFRFFEISGFNLLKVLEKIEITLGQLESRISKLEDLCNTKEDTSHPKNTKKQWSPPPDLY